MRLANTDDINNLVITYQDAVDHANDVGKIDWPNPIPKLFVAELISTQELYCFEDSEIVAAVKISRQRDERIWHDDTIPALYVGKLATRNRVRGQGFFQHSMLPAIINFAGTDAALRLDCLADNTHLQNFYKGLGFTSLGDVAFYSEKQKRTLIVTRFEKAVWF